MRYLFVLAFALSTIGFGADKYTGPLPPKSDLPYLVHADNLIETEVGEAKEETRKDMTVAVLSGASSKARTPLAEPIFLIRTDKLSADKIQAYKLEVKNGNREVVVGAKKSKDISRPLFVQVKRLADRLYQIEIDQTLENGEYCLSPDGENRTFAFQIY